MNTASRRKFDQRAFVACMMALSGATLPVSGLANHLLQFDEMTLARHAWMAAHNSIAILFVVFTVWHALLNRRMLANHLRGIPSRLASAEFGVALLAIAAFALFFVGHACARG